VIHNQIPVIRRFTGGGTVIVDKETIFVTLICNRDAVPSLKLYPQPIMSWTGTLYQEALCDFGKFHLRENGKVIFQYFQYLVYFYFSSVRLTKDVTVL
jgi:lipoate-protein ligase A